MQNASRSLPGDPGCRACEGIQQHPCSMTQGTLIKNKTDFKHQTPSNDIKCIPAFTIKFISHN